MFSRFFKRSLCVVLSCTVLVFSCVFMPRQRAEASFAVPVIASVAGLFALGLLAYGVSTSADSDFVQSNCNDWADSIGLKSPSSSLQSVMTSLCASLFLSSVKGYAEAAYSSGACSTSFTGPLSPSNPHFNSSCTGLIFPRSDTSVQKFTSVFGGSNITGKLSFSSPSDVHIICNEVGDFMAISTSISSNSIFFNGGSFHSVTYPFLSSPFSYNYKDLTFYYDYIASTKSGTVKLFFDSLGFSFESSISYQDYISNYLYPSLSSSISADVSAKPVSSGACDVFNSSKSLDSYHVDSPGNDVLDLGNVLEKTGCESIDDVVSKVYTGDLSASDVIGGLDCRPYVDIDVDTGTIAIPGDTTISRPIALDQDLSIPSDIANTDTYEPINPPFDDTNSDRTNRPSGSYTFPLSNFFPFCLPWDIYKVLSIFNTSPKAPVISIPLGSFFSDIPGVDNDTIDYVCTIDLGDENFKKWFQILRLLESIGIIVGFVLISRSLIHGGD